MYFEFLLFHFCFSSLLMHLGKATEDGPGVGVPVTHLEVLCKAPGSGFTTPWLLMPFEEWTNVWKIFSLFNSAFHINKALKTSRIPCFLFSLSCLRSTHHYLNLNISRILLTNLVHSLSPTDMRVIWIQENRNFVCIILLNRKFRHF